MKYLILQICHKTTSQPHFDVIMTLLLRHVSTGIGRIRDVGDRGYISVRFGSTPSYNRSQYWRIIRYRGALIPLLWRHNGRDGISNHQPRDCLLNRSFGRGSKKTSKLRATGLCAGNSPATGEFPAQMASNAENVSIWWHHAFHVVELTRHNRRTQNIWLTHCGIVTPFGHIDLGQKDNVLLPDTTPLPKPILTYHQRCSVTFTSEHHFTRTCVGRLHVLNYHHICQGSMS